MDLKTLILLIDDDDLVLKSFKHLLERNRYTVLAVSSYAEAMEAFKNKVFDLVISDIRMPGKNGVETVSEIQRQLAAAGKPDLPIIFITGYSDDSVKLDAKFMGEVLHKPIDSEKLLTTVRDYL